MNENDVLQDEEISLFDLWQKLRAGWRLVVGGLALGMLAAVGVIGLTPARYEAHGLVQVGQVGQVGLIGQISQVNGQPVESSAVAVERMKTPMFQRRVAESLGDRQWLEQMSESAAGTTTGDLALQVLKATGGALIDLTATGRDPQAAVRKAEAAVAQLAKAHQLLAEPTITKMRKDLEIAREKLVGAERDLEAIGKLVAGAAVKDERFTQLSLLTSVRLQKEAEIFGQRQAIMAIETALSAPATQPAKVVEEIYTQEKPVSPRIRLLVALGAIGGLFLGVLAVFVRDGWRRAKEARRTRQGGRE